MIQRLDQRAGKIPGFKMSGKLHDKDDYWWRHRSHRTCRTQMDSDSAGEVGELTREAVEWMLASAGGSQPTQPAGESHDRETNKLDEKNGTYENQ